MKVGADASQVPAIVRHIRNQKGGTWKDKVMAFQKKNGNLKVDGIVGDKTIAAMKRKDGAYENYDYKQKASPTKDPLMEPRGKGSAGLTLEVAREKREAARKRAARNTSIDMQNRLNQVSKDREARANRNVNFLARGERSKTENERRRGGEHVPNSANEIVQVSSLRGKPQLPSWQVPPASSTKHPYQKATLKNLTKSERAAFEHWYQQKKG